MALFPLRLSAIVAGVAVEYAETHHAETRGDAVPPFTGFDGRNSDFYHGRHSFASYWAVRVNVSHVLPSILDSRQFPVNIICYCSRIYCRPIYGTPVHLAVFPLGNKSQVTQRAIIPREDMGGMHFPGGHDLFNPRGSCVAPFPCRLQYPCGPTFREHCLWPQPALFTRCWQRSER
jgi:hypothetical protein